VIRVVLSVLFSLVSISLLAQACPTAADSETGSDTAHSSVLHGRMVYHNDLRQWLGLRLDKPACGQYEIQLVFNDAAAWSNAEALRSCQVTVIGKIFESPTGYYSAVLAVSEPSLLPDRSCHAFPTKPDLSAAPIASSVHLYHVSITVDYRGKGQVSVHVSDGNRTTPLEPWQAYAHYMLTGGADVIWFGCRKEFQLEHARGTEILPGDDDAGASLGNPRGLNTITYSCERKQRTQ
jgi:hypothetical protein